MLDVMRRISQSDQAMRRGEWPLMLGYVLKGKTLGILGLGKIGTEVAAIARAFGMKVIAWGPTLTQERAGKSAATFMPLEDVLRSADVVSVHLKLSDDSKNLLNEARLRLMKQSAYLVNTARGAIVDEMALVKILQEKAIAGAALDVFVEEPLPKNHPITQLDNVVLTPHLGWPTDSGFEGFAENAVTNILDYMAGKLTRALNPEAMSNRGKPELNALRPSRPFQVHDGNSRFHTVIPATRESRLSAAQSTLEMDAGFHRHDDGVVHRLRQRRKHLDEIG